MRRQEPVSADWLVPDWPAPPAVGAVCTTRTGGVSVGAFAGLNLGDHVGDDPAAVAKNRDRLAAAIGVRPVFLRQVHGIDVLRIDAQTPDGATADAAVSTASGVACTVMVADCLPLLLCDTRARRVAAVHVGWRGLAQGVIESVFRAWPSPGLRAQPAAAAETLAWLGPCIGPRAFQIGPEVRAALLAADPGAAGCFSADEGNRWRADLPVLVRRRLAALGVQAVHGNDGGQPWCTVGNPARWFSHRRDGVSGRMAACVWLRG